MTGPRIRPLSFVLILIVVACLAAGGGYSTVAIFSADETATGTFETAAEFDSAISMLGADVTPDTTLERTPVRSWNGDVVLTHEDDTADGPSVTVDVETNTVLISVGESRSDHATLHVDTQRVLTVVDTDGVDGLSAAVTNGSDSFAVVDGGNESRLRFELYTFPATITITGVDSSDGDDSSDPVPASETDETSDGETETETETESETLVDTNTETETDTETANDDPEDSSEALEDESTPEGTTETGPDASDGDSDDRTVDGEHSPATEPDAEDSLDELE